MEISLRKKALVADQQIALAFGHAEIGTPLAAIIHKVGKRSVQRGFQSLMNKKLLTEYAVLAGGKLSKSFF